MKVKNILVYAAVILLAGMIAGCSKTNPTVFSWQYGGANYVADSSSISGSTYKIVAYSGLTAVGINPNTKPVVGTYTIHPENTVGQPYMVYIQITSYLYSQSGTLNVTYNDNTKISGNFSVTFTDGSVMTGQFSDIPYK